MVLTILKNMSSSMGKMTWHSLTFHILWKNKHVWNILKPLTSTPCKIQCNTHVDIVLNQMWCVWPKKNMLILIFFYAKKGKGLHRTSIWLYLGKFLQCTKLHFGDDFSNSNHDLRSNSKISKVAINASPSTYPCAQPRALKRFGKMSSSSSASKGINTAGSMIPREHTL